MTRLYGLSASEMAERIRNGELAAEEYIMSVLERMSKLEEKMRCFVTPTKEEALEKARKIDKKTRKREELGRLLGVAVAVKDSMCTKDVRTTCSSRMLLDFVPPRMTQRLS